MARIETIISAAKSTGTHIIPDLSAAHGITDTVATTTIYHQGLFHSVKRNPSLNCLHRRRSLAILGHACRTQVADKVVSPSCFRSSLPSCPLSWCPLCHYLCPYVFFESCNVSLPSMYSLLDNVYDIIYTGLMSYPGITFVVA